MVEFLQKLWRHTKQRPGVSECFLKTNYVQFVDSLIQYIIYAYVLRKTHKMSEHMRYFQNVR